MKAVKWGVVGAVCAAIALAIGSAKQGRTSEPDEFLLIGALGALVGVTLSGLRPWMVRNARNFILGWTITAAVTAIGFGVMDLLILKEQATVVMAVIFLLVLIVGVFDWWLVWSNP